MQSPVKLPARLTVALEVVRYDKTTGLVPVIVQDVDSGQVLTLAYANREALKRTLGTGQAWFWSRSRQEYWRKGATSGNVQQVVEVRVDCDGDAVLYRVHPNGPACHTGEISCFYQAVQHGAVPVDVRFDVGRTNVGLHAASSPPANANAVAKNAGDTDEEKDAEDTGSVNDADRSHLNDLNDLNDELNRLWEVLSERWQNRPQGSYTTYLFEHGIDKVGKKVGEEAVEVVLAAKNAVNEPHTGQAELASESADLLYHLLALWKTAGIGPSAVSAVLRARGMG